MLVSANVGVSTCLPKLARGSLGEKGVSNSTERHRTARPGDAGGRTGASAMSAGTKPERRGRRARLSMGRPGKGVGDNCAKAPLALCIRLERVLEGLLVEVRPQAVGEIQLGVRALPKPEVAQAPVAAGANQQIHLGRPRHCTIARR